MDPEFALEAKFGIQLSDLVFSVPESGAQREYIFVG